MPIEKGKEWDHVAILELKDKLHQHKVLCKYCTYVFVGGASRIREYFLHIIPACGIAKCTADEAFLVRWACTSLGILNFSLVAILSLTFGKLASKDATHSSRAEHPTAWQIHHWTAAAPHHQT